MSLEKRARWFLQGASHHITMRIAYRYAKKFPQYFVAGFPRSGTSWLSEMVADYYNLPRPRHYYLPIAFAAVLHTHFKPNKKFINTFYIYRDGRDSYASSYFKKLRLINDDPHFVYAAYYRELFRNKVDNLTAEDHQLNFMAFLQDEYSKGKIWSKHIEQWQSAAETNRGIAVLSFEGLLQAPVEVLGEAIRCISGEVDKDVLSQVVQKNSFAEQIKRPKEQHRTVLRKGKKNSWKECFSREAAHLFQQSCGDHLIALGYESDANWLNDLSTIKK